MKKKILVNKEPFVLFLSEKKIRDRVKQLGKKLSKDYKDRVPIFIGVLNGSFIFFADLIREITIDCEMDFLKLSSYGDAKISSGNVTMLKDLNCQVEHRDI
ncbi:MAG: hypoxanthine phosphoribosyltransferase, partial [Bacteroidota bacterium]|nr:hypoxanthine phosphoribosyltransferase [Bacteroidota bacterium]